MDYPSNQDVLDSNPTQGMKFYRDMESKRQMLLGKCPDICSSLLSFQVLTLLQWFCPKATSIADAGKGS